MPPHLTLKPSKKQKSKTTKRKNKRKNEKKTKNTKIQKKTFQLSVNFFFFRWVSKISLLLTTWSKNAHPKNTIKIGVSATHFLKNSFVSRNGHFWIKKSQIQKFQLSFYFFCLFSSPSTTETPKLAEPLFL